MNREERKKNAQYLADHLIMIDQQIAVIEYKAKVMGIHQSELRSKDGQWPMVDLLSAKSQTLLALAMMG